MPQPLPFPETLRAAVEAVIAQNKAEGYPPTRFIQATSSGNPDGGDPELRKACSNLICNHENLEWIEQSLRDYPGLLLLEDLVARHGGHYGLSQCVIEAAKARLKTLDVLVYRQRPQQS